jgi:hypothetical protein
MKFVSILLLILSLFTTATFSQEIELNVFTGFVAPSPSNDLSNERNSGVIVGAGVAKIISPRFALSAKVQYSNLPLNRNGMFDSRDLPPETTLLEGNALTMLSIAVQPKLMFPSTNAVASYLFISPKFNMLYEDDILISTTDDDIVLERENEKFFSVETGIGLDIEIEKTKLFVETGIDYSFRTFENSILVPIRLGVIFSF